MKQLSNGTIHRLFISGVFSSVIIVVLAISVTISIVSANSPPNLPILEQSPTNLGWFDANAFAPRIITSFWRSNVDPEGTSIPFWLYFYLIKWDGSQWVSYKKGHASRRGGITKTASFTLTVSFASTPTRPTFYISPTGSDSNPGTSAAPWKTWTYALSQLDPGETLIVKNGTWTNSSSCSGLPSPCLANTTLPAINCSSGYENGTATNRITIKAENERQAFLKSDGTKHAFQMDNCSYWNIEGLRGEATDRSGSLNGYVFQFNYVNNVNVKRLLAAKPNRYGNTHAIGFNYSSNSLVEESEAYWFHRWGIISYQSDGMTFRRNYANSRDYPDLAGAYASIVSNMGDYGIGHYSLEVVLKTRNSIVENCITEDNSTGFDAGASPVGGFNKILGSISRSNINYGFLGAGRGAEAHNGLIKDTVSIDDNSGMSFWSGTNMRVENVTVYSSEGWGLNIIDLYDHTTFTNNEFRSTFIANALVFSGATGMTITGHDDWLVDYSNSFGNGSANFPTDETIGDASGNIQHSMSVSPTGIGLGTNQCIVYIPSNSNMKGAGKNGADIGANIIYRYENGVLTSKKLWNQTTGQFPCGATVAGVNDDATYPTSSCVNVHKRLNVGVNGCPIP